MKVCARWHDVDRWKWMCASWLLAGCWRKTVAKRAGCFLFTRESPWKWKQMPPAAVDDFAFGTTFCTVPTAIFHWLLLLLLPVPLLLCVPLSLRWRRALQRLFDIVIVASITNLVLAGIELVVPELNWSHIGLVV